jgi:N-acetylglucosamine-6-sulfatase
MLSSENAGFSRRDFLKAAAASALTAKYFSSLGMAAPTGHAKKWPNIVVILADDQRFNELACTGHAFAQTPHTDRLAREGVLFTNAVVSTPLCGPNRACLYTGCFAHKHHLRNHGTDVAKPLPIPVPCFPALLRDAGYQTALFGKFHDGESIYADHGFAHFEPDRNPYIDPEFFTDGKWTKVTGHVDYIITDKASRWIQSNYKSGHFLAVLSHCAPHMPIAVPEDKKDLYRGAIPVRRPDVNDITGEGKSECIRGAQEWFRSMRTSGNIPGWTWPPPFSDEQLRDRMRLSRVLDDSVGRIYSLLKDIGELDNTIFIYHSDNGYFLGEHGLSEKYYPYEEALRVPLIIRFPSVGAVGQKCQNPVYTLDIAPTLLEFAGVDIPGTIDGKSLMPLLKNGKKAAWRDTTFHEFFYDKGVDPYPTWQAIRTSKWKYIRFCKPFYEEFYDLQNDPYELKNLATVATHKKDLEENRVAFEKITRSLQVNPIMKDEHAG